MIQRMKRLESTKQYNWSRLGSIHWHFVEYRLKRGTQANGCRISEETRLIVMVGLLKTGKLVMVLCENRAYLTSISGYTFLDACLSWRECGHP